jgi:hypothetical protein
MQDMADTSTHDHRKGLFAIFILSLVALIAWLVFPRHQGIDWSEGESTLSPNKKWFVGLRTGTFWDKTNQYTQIQVYDTEANPELKQNSPPTDPGSKTTASFIVPVPLHARDVELKWNGESTILHLEQVSLNMQPAIHYDLDLKSFSLTKVEK